MKIDKPITITVRDRGGNIVQREEGHLLDGDVVQIPMMLRDAASGVPASGAALAAGRRILGDGFSPADYAGLSADAARHAIVKRKLGAAAVGKPVAFLDAAWRVLASDAPSAPAKAATLGTLVLSDAQRAVAQAGVRDALAHHAAASGRSREQEIADGHWQARKAILADAWKGPERRAEEARNAGLTYQQRMARAWQGGV